jgi:3-oxoacyl-[acyl-carrier protein] reductase
MPTSQFSVEGRTAVVTGASRGIGRSIAERFAADGASIGICSRTLADVEAVADEINESCGEERVFPVECDVRDREAVEELIAATENAFGPVDLLVNNAGGNFVSEFQEISENGWQTIVDINLNGTYRCTQVAAESMCDRGGGEVINLSSIAGQGSSPGESVYGAAKAAVADLTKTLATEYAEDGVRVNCIAPGLIQTPGVADVLGHDADDLPERAETDRHLGRPDEVADLAQFLASSASSFLNGETVTARGLPPTEDPNDL